MIGLLHGNVLAALVLEGHIHHAVAVAWFEQFPAKFATCTVTQGTLLRVHMLTAVDKSADTAWNSLKQIARHPRHVFWEDGFSFQEVSSRYIQGHRQVTDAWLAEMARRRRGKLITFDGALALLHRDVAARIDV